MDASILHFRHIAAIGQEDRGMHRSAGAQSAETFAGAYLELCRRRDSNPRLADYDSAALPPELTRHDDFFIKNIQSSNKKVKLSKCR